ncbi:MULTISPECIES: pseudouridine synthase [Stutzerimonas stutzeri subgroup]|jgi:16S rRNA pseudouridine516 synthase|uniref:Pseudouridine synthase n=1 Tax=Stutzerimonas stutzeri NF13 TaxID=1212548 RepID=M2VGL4_STUST|nr:MULTISPECIES: pseudouridine synthase [Stutzerimonas stutzeri subgroup]MBS67641.1 16S rRNA pseudouridine(516) synthase [Pseudomonas sp.]WOF80239.1 pseudouridine synthase [Pseudomonas sp. FeN3W]EMD99122.1 pseudouridylate synthase [Stutzerimonas stutzeri NF13]MBK3880435.1 pseudouridine synthase [Stutzerimonas stutzeri]MCQ4292336.1 pseudouridine synthase [Stutzerimonas stutzeri]|tara:strand:+ start:683 stop:1375 length:693 start_codon:yes stop_codon:yes gene_type:complete
MRLDRYLANRARLSRQDVQRLLADGRVQVNGETSQIMDQEVRVFDRIELDGELLQAGKAARYLMLHKPTGCVSATQDATHRTVLDLIDEPDKQDLHIAGRLDFNTTGLMLLTNDGQWSRRLTQPTSLQGKVYLVETEDEIDPACVDVFARGIYFRFENLTTLPAELVLLAPRRARLTLHEGRYHQVKRMFGHFNNKVTALHRESMGPLTLDPALEPGRYRPLTAHEIAQI